MQSKRRGWKASKSLRRQSPARGIPLYCSTLPPPHFNGWRIVFSPPNTMGGQQLRSYLKIAASQMTNSARIGKIIYVNSQAAAREPAPGALVQEQAPKLAAPPHGSQRPAERARLQLPTVERPEAPHFRRRSGLMRHRKSLAIVRRCPW